MTKPIYRRVVAKISGEALTGRDGFGINKATLERIAGDLVAAHKLGTSLGVVIGGGNIVRGVTVSGKGIPRVTGDLMGMLATVINALALESAIEKAGVAARTMSALTMPQLCESYERRRALRHLDEGRVVLFAGGTGNPFFTTDTTAVLRAAEIGAEAVLKATEAGQECKTLRPVDAPGSDRARPESHGYHRVRTCSGKSYAYHRVLDPRSRSDRGGAARRRTLDRRWQLIRLRRWPARCKAACSIE